MDWQLDKVTFAGDAHSTLKVWVDTPRLLTLIVAYLISGRPRLLACDADQFSSVDIGPVL